MELFCATEMLGRIRAPGGWQGNSSFAKNLKANDNFLRYHRDFPTLHEPYSKLYKNVHASLDCSILMVCYGKAEGNF